MKYAFIIIDGNIRRPVDRISSGIALRLCGSIHIQFSCAYYVHVCFPKMPNSRKGSRSLNRRYSRKRRRTFCGNQHTIETETSYASTMHMNFPEGLNSWCKWRVAEARDNLDLLFMIHSTCLFMKMFKQPFDLCMRPFPATICWRDVSEQIHKTRTKVWIRVSGNLLQNICTAAPKLLKLQHTWPPIFSTRVFHQYLKWWMFSESSLDLKARSSKETPTGNESNQRKPIWHR